MKRKIKIRFQQKQVVLSLPANLCSNPPYDLKPIRGPKIKLKIHQGRWEEGKKRKCTQARQILEACENLTAEMVLVSSLTSNKLSKPTRS